MQEGNETALIAKISTHRNEKIKKVESHQSRNKLAASK